MELLPIDIQNLITTYCVDKEFIDEIDAKSFVCDGEVKDHINSCPYFLYNGIWRHIRYLWGCEMLYYCYVVYNINNHN